MEDLKRGLLNYEVVEKFLADLKKKFRGGNEETNKVAELRRLEQRGKMIEEFI